MLIALAITSAGITMRTVQPNRSPILALTVTVRVVLLVAPWSSDIV